ncbi:MAG: orotate phosphoribosyltransferase [Deltaproteobacteria bacterium]|nr:orotate phosphoribosyltransferase [Deltaproteobacteria bacterium]
MERERLLNILREKSYEKREVTLASGRKSDFYIDCKQTTLDAEGAYLTGKLMYEIINRLDEKIEGAGGLTLGADPIATAVSIASYQAGKPLPAFIIRKEPKGHGTGQWLEGTKNLRKGSKVVIVEDVVTTGGSSLKAVKRAEQSGLNAALILALVDRCEGGRENIEKEGYKLKSLFERAEIVG